MTLSGLGCRLQICRRLIIAAVQFCLTGVFSSSSPPHHRPASWVRAALAYGRSHSRLYCSSGCRAGARGWQRLARLSSLGIESVDRLHRPWWRRGIAQNDMLSGTGVSYVCVSAHGAPARQGRRVRVRIESLPPTFSKCFARAWRWVRRETRWREKHSDRGPLLCCTRIDRRRRSVSRVLFIFRNAHRAVDGI